MSIFKSKGFDTIIGKNTKIVGIGIHVVGTMQLDGDIVTETISGADDQKSLLHVGGNLTAETIEVFNVTICGHVDTATIKVEGTLAVRGDATLRAKNIYYRSLVVEPGCIIQGEMKHLDHVSEGEKV